MQQVVGSFLYYGRAVDLTILMDLSKITEQQANPTDKTTTRVNQLLDYMATHPMEVIRYHKYDMLLNVHVYASYGIATKSRIRAGGHFLLGSIPTNDDPIKLNGTILTNCTILKCVAASAAEAEIRALFLNAMEAKSLRLTLMELGHPQPQIKIHVENTTEVGIFNNTIKRQRSSAMNRQYFWLLCQEAQLIFRTKYHPGQENFGDYKTKHRNRAAHQRVRPFYVQTKD